MAELIAASALGWPALLTLFVIASVLVILASELAPTDLTMMGGLLILVLARIVSPSDAVRGFANEALLSVGALFIVAAAVRKTGALAYVDRWMTPRSNSVPGAILRMMIPSSVLSSVMNNTPIVAILAPLAQERGRAAGISPSKLLIPLAYATTLGGLITLIGTSTNLVVSGLLTQNGYEPIAMFDLTWVGIPAAIVAILYFSLGAHRLLPDRADNPAFDRNELRVYHFELRVPSGSALDGKTVEEAGLRALKGAFLAHIYRSAELISLIAPNQVLREGDVLAFVGNPQHLDGLLHQRNLLRVIEPPTVAEDQPLPLFEAVIASDSAFIGKSLSELDFRERFQAIVLGIHRRDKRVSGLLGRTAIEPGDLFLVEARPQFEAMASASGEFYLVAPLERGQQRLTRRAPRVLFVLVAMVLAIGTGIIPITTATFAAAILMVLAGGITAVEARRSVDLSVLVTVAAGFGIADALQATGLAHFIAELIVRAVHGYGPIAVLAAVYLATNMLTEILSHNAAAVLVFPIAVAAANALGTDVHPFAIAVAVAASAAFTTPIGYQTYLMVMGPGSYRFGDFVKVGLPLNILVMTIALPIIVFVWM